MLAKKEYKYGNIPPMNDFGIAIFQHCPTNVQNVLILHLELLIAGLLNAPFSF
jgi:hypothetical protein